MKLTVDKTRLVEAIKAAITKKEAFAAAQRAKMAEQLPPLKRQLAQARKEQARYKKAHDRVYVLEDRIGILKSRKLYQTDTAKEKSILRRLEMVVGDTLEVSDQDDYFKYI